MRCITILSMLGLSAPCLAVTPWTDEPGSGQLVLSYIDEGFEEFSAGSGSGRFPGEVSQRTAQLAWSYGLRDGLSVGIRSGVTRTDFEAGTRGVFRARNDTHTHIKWALLDEYSDSPVTLSVIATYILQGNYPPASAGNPYSPGDGASGGSLEVSVGRRSFDGWSLAGSVGYRARNSQVPDEILADLHASYNITPRWGVAAQLSRTQSLYGLQLNGSDFTGDRFHQLEEIVTSLSLSTWRSLSAQWVLGIQTTALLETRNSGKRDIYAISLGYQF